MLKNLEKIIDNPALTPNIVKAFLVTYDKIHLLFHHFFVFT